MGLINNTAQPWAAYIKGRIKNNKNFIGFVGGPTGSGKSYASLAIAELIDPKFSIDHCVFTGAELMALVNSNKLKKGSVIVFEEAGIEMSAQSWQSIMNKMLNFLMQTFRHRNFVLILNSPFMDFVAAATRKLFHAELATQRIDFEKEMTVLKPQIIQYNSRYKKFYYKYLRVGVPGKGMGAVKTWSVPKPSADLLKAYEIKKREFTDNLNAEIQEQIINQSKKTEKKEWTCPECSHEWKPRTKTPYRCPRCQNRALTPPQTPISS